MHFAIVAIAYGLSCGGTLASGARFMRTREEPAKHKSLLVLMRVGSEESPKRVESIKKTWAKDLEDGALTLLQKDETCVKLYGDNHWKGLTCLEAANHLRLMNRTDFDWLLVVDDDAYVFADRLRNTLANMDPSKDQVFGTPYCNTCGNEFKGFCGGSGYVLSRQSLLKMAGAKEAPVSAEAGQAFIDHMMRPPHNKWCDVRFGCVAQEKGLKAISVKGMYGNGIVDGHGNYDAVLESRVVELGAREPPLVFHNVKNLTHMEHLYELSQKENQQFETQGKTSAYSDLAKWSW